MRKMAGLRPFRSVFLRRFGRSLIKIDEKSIFQKMQVLSPNRSKKRYIYILLLGTYQVPKQVTKNFI